MSTKLVELEGSPNIESGAGYVAIEFDEPYLQDVLDFQEAMQSVTVEVYNPNGD